MKKVGTKWTKKQIVASKLWKELRRKYPVKKYSSQIPRAAWPEENNEISFDQIVYFP